MPLISDNEFPKVIMAEGAAPATPGTGLVKLYAGTDGGLYVKNDAGTEFGPLIGDTAGISVLLVSPTAADYIDVVIPFASTITEATLLADIAGDLVVDIWVDTYANYPPTVADTITASAKPTLSTAIKSQDTTLTGWTTALLAGDVLRVYIDSAATLAQATLFLGLSRA